MLQVKYNMTQYLTYSGYAIDMVRPGLITATKGRKKLIENRLIKIIKLIDRDKLGTK